MFYILFIIFINEQYHSADVKGGCRGNAETG